MTTPLQQTRVDVFQDIFTVFLGLGTLVGILVVAYTVYNAYKYREDEAEPESADTPTLGELPTGGKGGKKLFLSFGLSAIIVVSLIVWTYGMLLYVEDGPQGPDEDAVEVDVTGSAFSWGFEYVDEDVQTSGELIVPEDRQVWLNVTSIDVWHSFGLTDQRAKADAIPGETDETWFIAEETGTHEEAIECFELCGEGHSGMTADFTVVDEDLYDAAAEEDALDVLFDGLGSDLDVDSTPSEFDAYHEEVTEEESEEESDDNGEESENTDDSEDGSDTDGNESNGGDD